MTAKINLYSILDSDHHFVQKKKRLVILYTLNPATLLTQLFYSGQSLHWPISCVVFQLNPTVFTTTSDNYRHFLIP